MTIDHLSFGTQDINATRVFYAEKLCFPVLICERILIQEGGAVEHIFFDCGGDCALAFMQWHNVPGVPGTYDCGINRGLGVPNGTFHFALRCLSQEALVQRRQELIAAEVLVGEILDLDPYRSFFFDDPVNGLRLEYTTRLRLPGPTDRDPDQRQFPASLQLFENAALPLTHEPQESTQLPAALE
jgi:catechol 2,3-dioxygenase-like lactoylglutathione lyase family enzyme